MSKKRKEAAASADLGIEELQQRFQALNTRKIQAETSLEHATKQLNELREEAREKYGTDDVEALRQKLQSMTAENEQKRAEYQSTLDQIEKDLAAVEAKFAPGDEGAGDTEEAP